MRSEITSVRNIQEVSALLAVPGSRIIAGGTTFSAKADNGLHLVDISGLEGLDGIKQKGTRIELGPLTTLDALQRSMLLKSYAPVLAEAAAAASPEIRERGTLGGALAGDPAGDPAVALMASGAKLTVKTDCDFRELMIERFWPVSGGNDLNYDEWITRITLPLPKEAYWGDAFGRLGTWDAEQVPAAAAAVRVCVDEKRTVTSARGGLRLGKSDVRRMFPLEKALKNRPFTEENTEKAAEMMLSSVKDPMPEEELRALLKELLHRAFAMAEERRAL